MSRGPEEKEQSQLGEGIDAVMQVIDDLVADGEAAARDAAKSVLEATDESEELVEQAVAEVEDKIAVASTEVESALDTTTKDDAVYEDTIKESIAEASDAVEYEAKQVADVANDVAPDTDGATSNVNEEL